MFQITKQHGTVFCPSLTRSLKLIATQDRGHRFVSKQIFKVESRSQGRRGSRRARVRNVRDMMNIDLGAGRLLRIAGEIPAWDQRPADVDAELFALVLFPCCFALVLREVLLRPVFEQRVMLVVVDNPTVG